MRLTILLPVIGYFILFNDKVGEFLRLNSRIEAPQASPSTNLMLVYFGLLILSMGSTLYAYYCHDRVKYYGTATAYIGGDGPHLTTRTYDDILYELQDTQYEALAPRSEFMEQFPERVPEFRKDILDLVFRKWDSDYPIARAGTAVFYIAGLVILFIPSANVFFKVAGIFFRRIL
jgi:hypothetical protein